MTFRMGLIVVDPDEQSRADLCQQLSRLGYDVTPVRNAELADEICRHVLPDLLICARLDWAKSLASSHGRLPVILATSETPSSDCLLDAIRGGLADVWQTPLNAEFAAASIASVSERFQLSQSQTEVRLKEYVNELQRDQRAGRYIQMGMLPPNPMAIDRYRFQHRILPSLILSGDFVDYFRITERYFVFYVADVSGHGASSAFVTVLLKNFSRRLRREYRPSMIEHPGEILEWINRELLEQKIDKHVVMVLAMGDLETNSFTLVNAGHFPPAILVNAQGAKYVEQRGKPIGLFQSVSYEAMRVELTPGDRLVIFSDGILDAMENMDLAQKEAALLVAAGHEQMDSIWEALSINESAAPDDMTCLTVIRES